jgi:hypothetical protein
LLGRKQVEAAFRHTGLLMLPNLAVVLPKGEIADYAFQRNATGLPFQMYLVVYTTIEQARRESVDFQHGVSPRKGYFVEVSRTLRVRNVLFVFGVSDSLHDSHTVTGAVSKLTAALSRLGKPVSP